MPDHADLLLRQVPETERAEVSQVGELGQHVVGRLLVQPRPFIKCFVEIFFTELKPVDLLHSPSPAVLSQEVQLLHLLQPVGAPHLLQILLAEQVLPAVGLVMLLLFLRSYPRHPILNTLPARYRMPVQATRHPG